MIALIYWIRMVQDFSLQLYRPAHRGSKLELLLVVVLSITITNEQTFSLQITDSVSQMETDTMDTFATYQPVNYSSIRFPVHERTK